MKLTIYNKFIQTLVFSNQKASILLATLLVDDPRYLFVWCWYANRRRTCSDSRETLETLGLPTSNSVLMLPSILFNCKSDLFREAQKVDRKEDFENYCKKVKQS